MAKIKREICDPAFVTVVDVCIETEICGGEKGTFERVMDGSKICSDDAFVDCGCPKYN